MGLHARGIAIPRRWGKRKGAKIRSPKPECRKAACPADWHQLMAVMGSRFRFQATSSPTSRPRGAIACRGGSAVLHSFALVILRTHLHKCSVTLLIQGTYKDYAACFFLRPRLF